MQIQVLITFQTLNIALDHSTTNARRLVARISVDEGGDLMLNDLKELKSTVCSSHTTGFINYLLEQAETTPRGFRCAVT